MTMPTNSLSAYGHMVLANCTLFQPGFKCCISNNVTAAAHSTVSKLSTTMGCFVCVSCQVDLDLGNYERFLDITLTRDHNITTGKIYQVRSTQEKRRREVQCNLAHLLQSALQCAVDSVRYAQCSQV